jgi:ketosteroid isomerase-like protein
MSQDSGEIVRRAFDAFGRGDIEAVLSLCDEDIVITQPPELFDASRRQHGHAGVLEAFAIWPEQWDDYRIEVLRVVDLGDHVFVATQTHGRGKQSEIEVTMEIAFVFSVRDGKIAEMRIFMREDQALEAAGLLE